MTSDASASNNAVKLTGRTGHAPCSLGSAPHLPARARAQGARPFRPAAYRGRYAALHRCDA